MFGLDCTKSVTMPDIVVVVDNDISVHCKFSESGPIVGNYHRALVSRLSSGHRCLLVMIFSNLCLNCFHRSFLLSYFCCICPELCSYQVFRCHVYVGQFYVTSRFLPQDDEI